jgi:hypothetical protein
MQLQAQEASGAGCRLAPAFEAVAGTLKCLTVGGGSLLPMNRAHLPIALCYELGAAISKLRHLKYLDFHALPDCRAHHAIGRGMAASGGCPELFEVRLITGYVTNAEWLTREPSLIVPSVRDLHIEVDCREDQGAACVLRIGTSGLQVSLAFLLACLPADWAAYYLEYKLRASQRADWDSLRGSQPAEWIGGYFGYSLRGSQPAQWIGCFWYGTRGSQPADWFGGDWGYSLRGSQRADWFGYPARVHVASQRADCIVCVSPCVYAGGLLQWWHRCGGG